MTDRRTLLLGAGTALALGRVGLGGRRAKAADNTPVGRVGEFAVVIGNKLANFYNPDFQSGTISQTAITFIRDFPSAVALPNPYNTTETITYPHGLNYGFGKWLPGNPLAPSDQDAWSTEINNLSTSSNPTEQMNYKLLTAIVVNNLAGPGPAVPTRFVCQGSAGAGIHQVTITPPANGNPCIVTVSCPI